MQASEKSPPLRFCTTGFILVNQRRLRRRTEKWLGSLILLWQ